MRREDDIELDCVHFALLTFVPLWYFVSQVLIAAVIE
jgi:hypothetical protein